MFHHITARKKLTMSTGKTVSGRNKNEPMKTRIYPFDIPSNHNPIMCSPAGLIVVKLIDLVSLIGLQFSFSFLYLSSWFIVSNIF